MRTPRLLSVQHNIQFYNTLDLPHGTNHPDREVIKIGKSFLNLFCGNLVRSGRFIAGHHVHPIQEGLLAHLQWCGWAVCVGNKISFFNDLSSFSGSEVSPRALSGSCLWFLVMQMVQSVTFY